MKTTIKIKSYQVNTQIAATRMNTEHSDQNRLKYDKCYKKNCHI